MLPVSESINDVEGIPSQGACHSSGHKRPFNTVRGKEAVH